MARLEVELYPPVKQWFASRPDNVVVTSDSPKDKLKVRVKRDGAMREIDIVALESTDGGFILHLAEGKRHAKGHSFIECLSQAESIMQYADYVWVFFPEDHWRRMGADDCELNRQTAMSRKIGILLVGDKGECSLVLAAEKSPRRKQEKVDIVLDQLGHGPNSAIPSLATNDQPGSSAGRMSMAGMAQDAAVTALTKIAGKFRWEGTADAECVRRNWYSCSSEWAKGPSVEIDPFGGYLRDGRMVMWFWVDVTNAQLKKYLSAPRTFGTHVFRGKSDWDWDILPVDQVTPATVEQMGMDREDGSGEYFVAHMLDIPGQRRDPFVEQIRLVWQAGAKVAKK